MELLLRPQDVQLHLDQKRLQLLYATLWGLLSLPRHCSLHGRRSQNNLEISPNYDWSVIQYRWYYWLRLRYVQHHDPKGAVVLVLSVPHEESLPPRANQRQEKEQGSNIRKIRAKARKCQVRGIFRLKQRYKSECGSAYLKHELRYNSDLQLSLQQISFEGALLFHI